MFDTQNDVDTAIDEKSLLKPYVAYVDEGGGYVDWNSSNGRDWSKEYLAFEILSAGTIAWKAQNTAYTTSIEYSTDNGSTWSTITSNTGASAPSINVSVGDKVLFKGNNAAYSSGLSYYNSFNGSTASFNVNGNIMSLLYGDNFSGQTAFSSAYTFVGLFNRTKVIDSSNLVLPATTLVNRCYVYMFQGCTGLTTAPELPATTLAEYCYVNMFSGCTSLTQAPELPATTLASSCYTSMFLCCTSLTQAPELPATALTSGCYHYMFNGCTSLTSAPALPATELAPSCYSHMFADCSGLTSAPELPATALTSGCYYAMFSGCRNLASSPALPVTTLASSCYGYMFARCTNLTTTPELPATTLAAYCYQGMFSGCTSLSQTPSELPATTLATSCYTGMFAGCTSITSAPELPATAMTYGCYVNMFSDCTSLTQAPELPATTLADGCYNGMFRNCLSLTTTPELPATTLSQQCYREMFLGCTGITSAPELPATSLTVSCYTGMFQNCTSLTTAPALPATTLTGSCYYGMFSGCTHLITAPVLPAKQLGTYCYYSMFAGCTSLTSAPELPAKLLSDYCYYGMFRACTNITEAPELPAQALVINCYSYMFYGCTKLAYIKAMFATTPSTTYTNYWVSGVKSTGTFVKNAETTWTTRSVHAIPTNWTIQTETPPYYPFVHPLTFEILSAGTINYNTRNGAGKTIQYAKNQTNNWTSISATTEIPVDAGDALYVRGNNSSYGATNAVSSTTFMNSTAIFNLKGNIMSLINSSGYTNLTGFNATDTFSYMFSGTNAVDASELVLPVKYIEGTKQGNIYHHNYYYMFANCSALTKSPKICTIIAKAYKDSSKTQYDNCDQLTGMFSNCASLQEIYWVLENSEGPNANLSANFSANVPINNGTFYKSINAKWDDSAGYGTYGIPEGWTIEKVDPNDIY